MAANAGFKIGDTVYEWPDRLKMTDFALIEELTGLDSAEFAERVDRNNARREAGVPANDANVVTGWIGVAIWAAHPRWKRAQVVEFVQNLDMEKFEPIGGDDSPPVLGADAPASPSPEPSSESISSPVVSETVEDHV